MEFLLLSEPKKISIISSIKDNVTTNGTIKSQNKSMYLQPCEESVQKKWINPQSKV